MFDWHIPLPPVYVPPDSAEDFFANLVKYIKLLETKLDENQQLLICYYNQGAEVFVRAIAYHSRDLIVLLGQDRQGNEFHVLAHAQSVQLVLRIQQAEKDKPRRQIGFFREPDRD